MIKQSTNDAVRFSGNQLEIVRFCAIECKLQNSGENSVSWMINAWNYALGHQTAFPTEEHVLMLGELVDPDVNANGYRQISVYFGSDVKDVKMDWRNVPDNTQRLIKQGGDLSPEEWFFRYEEIHPFRDGNGRTGQILFNWLSGTLETPKWAPKNFWYDGRRQDGAGA